MRDEKTGGIGRFLHWLLAALTLGRLASAPLAGTSQHGRKARRGEKGISLALQGGGSHGAFTWGVLDRLLEEQDLTIEAVSGASAGAMNAAVLASGYLNGGRDAAREALAELWLKVSEAGRLSSFGKGFLAWTTGRAGIEWTRRVASPYNFNPLDLNPLRDLLEELVDFERLQRSRKLKLVVSATNVHTGSPRLFRNREISSEVLLASACLPHLYKAVDIDGAYYWDGGFTANPPILPLVQNGGPSDVLLVHIDAQGHPDLPTTAREISTRLERILMNAPLLREIQMIDELATLAEPGSELSRRFRRLALHHILPPEHMLQFEGASKLNTDWSFLTGLRDIGRQTAEAWLLENFDKIGTGRAHTFETSLLSLPKAGDAKEPSYGF
jgi:NTE family protein